MSFSQLCTPKSGRVPLSVSPTQRHAVEAVINAGLQARSHAAFAAVEAHHLRGALEVLGITQLVTARDEVALDVVLICARSNPLRMPSAYSATTP